MEITPTKIPGSYLIQPKPFIDNRGEFVKVYQREFFKEAGIQFDFAEEFFSISHKNVVRGMHFQVPPKAYEKLVYCINGSVLDVILDLRKNSPAFGRFFTRTLSAINREMIFIPEGVAHGFLALEENATMVYLNSVEHSPLHDAGILWNSFGFDWPVESPVLSKRDGNLPKLENFSVPF